MVHFITDEADRTPNELEIWYSGLDEFEAWLTAPDGSVTGPAPLGRIVSVMAERGTIGRLYHRRNDSNNGYHHLDIFLDPTAPPGRWTLALHGHHVRVGRFDRSFERDQASDRARRGSIGLAVDLTDTIGTIASGRLPLVVGAYDPHRADHPPALFSSIGPTRDKRSKPDILAAGVEILAARSAGRHAVRSDGGLVRKSGTSMATPLVTGTAVLVLNRRPAAARSAAPGPRSRQLEGFGPRPLAANPAVWTCSAPSPRTTRSVHISHPK